MDVFWKAMAFDQAWRLAIRLTDPCLGGVQRASLLQADVRRRGP